jgi:hypothetical protein
MCKIEVIFRVYICYWAWRPTEGTASDSALYIQDTNPSPYSTHLTRFGLEDWGSMYLRNVDSTANILLLFSSTLVSMTRCWIIYVLRCLQNLINVGKNIIAYGYVGLRVPTKQIREFPTFTSAMPQDLALQQGASRLQTTSAHLWAFSVNITSPSRVHFACLILLSHIIIRIKFWPSSSSSLSLAFVMYSFIAHLLYATRCWQELR